MDMIAILDLDGTTRDVDAALLRKRTIIDEFGKTPRVTAVEYRWPDNDQIVHRSATIDILELPEGMEGFAGAIT